MVTVGRLLILSALPATVITRMMELQAIPIFLKNTVLFQMQKSAKWKYVEISTTCWKKVPRHWWQKVTAMSIPWRLTWRIRELTNSSSWLLMAVSMVTSTVNWLLMHPVVGLIYKEITVSSTTQLPTTRHTRLLQHGRQMWMPLMDGHWK